MKLSCPTVSDIYEKALISYLTKFGLKETNYINTEALVVIITEQSNLKEKVFYFFNKSQTKKETYIPPGGTIYGLPYKTSFLINHENIDSFLNSEWGASFDRTVKNTWMNAFNRAF